MGTNKDGSTALSSLDVAHLAAEIEAMHYGHVVLELRVIPGTGRKWPRFSVVAANYVGTLRTARNTRAVVQRAWPGAGHRTLAGCMVGCLYDLSAALEELRATARGGATPIEAAISSSVTTDNL